MAAQNTIITTKFANFSQKGENNSKIMPDDIYFMEIAFKVAKASKCKRAKYGSVLVSADGRIISTGYNGKPRGSINDDICYREGLPDNSRGFVVIKNSPTKYKLIELSQSTFCFVDEEDFNWINQWKWYLSSTGYAVRNTTQTEKLALGKTVIKMHREIATIHGILQDQQLEVDHISGNRLDNRTINLRSCSHAENTRNGKLRINNTLGFPGIGKTETGEWRAHIKKDGKFIYLGKFKTKEEAKNCYIDAANELFGEFVRKSDIQYEFAPNCCLHSEANCLLFSDPLERLGGTLYVSGVPCTDCTLLIAQSGIKRVVFFCGHNKFGHRGNLDMGFIQKYGMKVEFDALYMAEHDEVQNDEQ